jgi:hypothetical protein
VAKFSSIVNKLIVLFILLLALFGLITLGWFAYKEESGQKSAAIPIIQASDSPIKIKPISEENLQEATADNKVYKLIDKNSKDSEKILTKNTPKENIQKQDIIQKAIQEKENLELSAKNIPDQVEENKQKVITLEKSQKTQLEISNAIKAVAIAEKKSDKTLEKQVQKQEVEKPKVVETKATQSYTLEKPIELVQEIKPKRQIEIPKPVEKPKILVEKDIKAKTSPNLNLKEQGGHYVQLGSFRSSPLATLSWNKLKQKSPSAIGKRKELIEKVEIEGKGIFYRLKTGPFEDRKKALDFCLKLIALNQSCIVLKK